MSLLRFAARSMLAGYFVADGVTAVSHPEPLVDQTAGMAQTVSKTVRRLLPESLKDKVPDDPATYVRIHGAIQVAGATMLATGFLRRFGAGLLALAYLPRVIAARPRRAGAADRRFLRELALLGGVAIAAMDTQGKPNLAWLATDRSQQLARASARFVDHKKAQLGQASAHLASDVGDRVQAVASRTNAGLRQAASTAHRQARRVASGVGSVNAG